jgi:hypothetical protein
VWRLERRRAAPVLGVLPRRLRRTGNRRRVSPSGPVLFDASTPSLHPLQAGPTSGRHSSLAAIRLRPTKSGASKLI